MHAFLLCPSIMLLACRHFLYISLAKRQIFVFMHHCFHCITFSLRIIHPFMRNNWNTYLQNMTMQTNPNDLVVWIVELHINASGKLKCKCRIHDFPFALIWNGHVCCVLDARSTSLLHTTKPNSRKEKRGARLYFFLFNSQFKPNRMPTMWW